MSSLAEIIDIKNGKIAPKNQGIYPIYGGNGIIGYSDFFNYEDVIIIGRVGANCGSVHIEKGKCWVSDNALAGLPKNKNSQFNYYLIKSLDLNNLQIGSSQPLLTQGILNNISLKFPEEKTEQQRIASILSSLDDKIELNNRINAELEAMAKTLYNYWFVQFDFPDANDKPYKSSGGKMVYNEELKREIPQGWEVKTLFEITSLIRRGISPKYVEDGGYLVLNQKCIRNQTIFFELGRSYDNKLSINDERLIELGDVLVNSTGVGTLGRVAFVKYIQHEKATVDSHITIVRGNSDLINIEYLNYWMLKSEKDIERAAEGSTGQVELRKEFLENMLVIMPSDDIQKKFSNIVIPLNGEMASREKENQHLAYLRDWLLPMLMNGQVGFKEAYKGQTQTVNIAAEAEVKYKPTPKNDNFQVGLKEEKREKTSIINQPQQQDLRFELWLSTQGLAARGEIDKTTLREIFDVMDEEEYGK